MEKEYRKRLLITALILAALLVGATWAAQRQQADAAIETGAWGLSFRTEGECPVGNASPEELAKYDAAFVGSGEDKCLYLTFDAGYENGHTAQILDVLHAHGAPAAFFVVGNFVAENPALVRRMAEEGHTVGNHTMHHYDMSRIANEQSFARELGDLEALYRETTGQELPRYYRPPRGVYSEENLKLAQKLGYRTVFWSLAYVDWKQDDQPTSEEAFAKLIGRVHNGAVILLHSTSATNAAILDELLTRYEELGYRFAPIGELFEGG